MLILIILLIAFIMLLVIAITIEQLEKRIKDLEDQEWWKGDKKMNNEELVFNMYKDEIIMNAKRFKKILGDRFKDIDTRNVYARIVHDFLIASWTMISSSFENLDKT